MIGGQQEGAVIAIVNPPTIDLSAIINAARHQELRPAGVRRSGERLSRRFPLVAPPHRLQLGRDIIVFPFMSGLALPVRGLS